MTSDTWLAANNRYLGASLHWLRLRLRAAAAPNADAAGQWQEPASVGPPAPSPSPKRPWYAFGHSSSAPAAAASAAPARAPASDDGAELARAGADRGAAAATDPPPALLLLAERLGLSPFERDTVLLCAALELDPDIGTLMAFAQGQAARNTPSFALALRVLDDPSWDALSPHRPLRYARLLEINQPGATPLTAAALRADERIVHYIKGLNVIDERLAGLLTPVSLDAEEPQLSASQQGAAQEVVRHLEAPGPQDPMPVIELLGIDRGSKLEVARQACALLNRHLYQLALADLPTHRAEIDALVRLWQRERMLLPLALYLDADDLDAAAPAAALHAFASRDIGPAFVGLREPPAPALADAVAITVLTPSAREQHDAWLAGLQDANAAEEAQLWAPRLAGQFNLNLRDIDRALSSAAAAVQATARAKGAWAACRQFTQPRLDQLAQRLDPKATWSDLVLADEATQLLRQIAAQVRNRYQVYEAWGYAHKMNRGLGISALFAGESGTGKTMAAEVVANELELSLYRIDLSAVVSKYIGETEKNLRRLFDAAEQGGAILLFDEADALFGKRSEVKDSHDRYANIEINYLLQRMEAFSGLAILATNMKSALDSAFMRRLRFVVNFQYPGAPERKRIWQGALPAALPQGEIDLERLARFGLSGGNIHSIALNAAFMAAERATPITQSLLMGAVRTELRKLGKAINEAEFR